MRQHVSRLILLLMLAGVLPAQAAVPAWIKVPNAAPRTVATPKVAPAPRPTAVRKATPPARRPQARRRRYAPPRRPPALLSRPNNMPLTGDIPMAVVALLAGGETDLAARRLYLEPATAQNLFLIREMQRIGEIKQGIRGFNKKDHQEWLNLGIAYHNLYLMTNSYQRPNRKFLGQAMKAYHFASRRAEGLHRDEAELLRAALEMATGKVKPAQRRFEKKVNAALMNETFRGATYLATYYAAAGDVEKTVAALERAHTFDSNHFLPHWVAISFDFAGMRDEPAFEGLAARWETMPARNTRSRSR